MNSVVRVGLSSLRRLNHPSNLRIIATPNLVHSIRSYAMSLTFASPYDVSVVCMLLSILMDLLVMWFGG